MNTHESKKKNKRFKDGVDDSFRTYMSRKIELQRKQFGLIEPKNSKGIFNGVVVLVNGYTNPNAMTIMRLMHKHGGDLEKYETSRVTHIIAEQLSIAKANIYKKQRNPIPVIYPNWILDSIQQNKRLHCGKYLLKEIQVQQPNAHSNCFQPIMKKSNKIRTVGTDPNFLESYFNTSRLSFIGSYKRRSKNEIILKKNKSDSNVTPFIFHIDMDCFFASVVLRNYPQYQNCPVAIGHNNITSTYNTNTSKSTSELSTCNYIARQYGIRKGMWYDQAKQLCPNLIVLPYDYEGYNIVSNQVSEILFTFVDMYNGTVEFVSCDEAYLELYIDHTSNNSQCHFIQSIAENIRKEIFQTTQCTASIGCSINKFLAKLATDKAKPDGSHVIPPNQWKDFIQNLNLRDLPGIGYKLEKKLKLRQILTVQDVWDLGNNAETELCSILGQGNGKKIIQFCHGKDSRKVASTPRKTIGAECNYGVRFDGPYGVDHMISGLAKEVEKRMSHEHVKGKHITLKIKQKKKDADEPSKFNGHGPCHSISKSEDAGHFFSDSATISALANKLYQQFDIDIHTIRGMGIVIGKLEKVNDQSMSWFQMVNDSHSTNTTMNTFHSSRDNEINLQNKNDIIDKNSTIAIEDTHQNNKKTLSIEEMNTQHNDANIHNNAKFITDSHDQKDHSILLTNEKNRHSNTVNNNRTERKDINERMQEQQEQQFDVMIPDSSKIDLEVLKSLPKYMQDDITRKIKQQKHISNQSRNTPIQKENMFHTSSLIMINDRHDKKRSTQSPKRHKKNEISNMKQVSVKRMLKLASVKSGNEEIEGIYNHENISMTQLGALPLDLQLQVANNDENKLGLTNTSIRKQKNIPFKKNHQSKVTLSKSSTRTKNRNIEMEKTDDELHIPMDDVCSYTMKNNILPLSKWLNSIPSPTDDDVNHVISFFVNVINENRLDDTVSMLRHIKNREDYWSSKSYNEILKAITAHLWKERNCVLDISWLGL